MVFNSDHRLEETKMSRRGVGIDVGSLFIGRLSRNTRVRDLEEIFESYGRMTRCDIKYGECCVAGWPSVKVGRPQCERAMGRNNHPALSVVPCIRHSGYPAGYPARPMSGIRPDIKIPAAVNFVKLSIFHTLLTSKLI